MKTLENANILKNSQKLENSKTLKPSKTLKLSKTLENFHKLSKTYIDSRKLKLTNLQMSQDVLKTLKNIQKGKTGQTDGGTDRPTEHAANKCQSRYNPCVNEPNSGSCRETHLDVRAPLRHMRATILPQLTPSWNVAPSNP